MPLDTSGYDGFNISLGLGDVETPQVVEFSVDPGTNDGAGVMCTYTGVLRFGAVGTSDSAWSRGSLVARIPTPGRRWSSISRGPEWTGFRSATATLSLASIFNSGAGNIVGWAVDAAIVEPFIPIGVAEPDDYLRIQALLAVCGTQGVLYRLSYQVSALGSSHHS